MSTKVKPKGFIAFLAQTICTSVALGSENPAIVAAAQTIGAAVSEAVNSIEISEKKGTPAKLYIDTFEKVLRESINETFETDGRDEEIIAELKEIQLSDCQIINEENKNALNIAIYEVLKGSGVYTDNISVGTIDDFIEKINTKMCDEIYANESLLLFVTNNDVRDIKATVKSTDTKVDNLSEKLDEMQAENKEHGELLRQIANQSSVNTDSDLQVNTISKFTQAVRDNKKYYIDKWNERLFLHRDKNDKPLTLSNTFIHHDYSVIDQTTGKTISENNNDIEQYLEDFIYNRTCDSLLVTGLPGMGKSSLVAYLANKYANDDSVIILRFKDFSKKELADNTHMPDYSGLHLAISNRIGIEVDDFSVYLDGKIVILDGFDELKNYGVNQSVLKEFIDILDYNKNIGLIITSRENYVDLNAIEFNSYLSLEPFSEAKIRKYYSVINGEKLSDSIQINNEKVLGIPVILYMALVVGIDISCNESKCELYERIFDIDEGIFERFKSWETGGHPVRLDKKALHQLLQNLAFYIFEHKEDSDDKETSVKKDSDDKETSVKKDSDDKETSVKKDFDDKETSVTEAIYIDLAKTIKNDKGEPAFSEDTRTILDFPIKNLYEGSGNIEFVHNSIYEYFTAEYIYQEIKKGLKDKNKEKFAGVLGKLFKKNMLSEEIIEYLYYKMSIDISNGSNQFFVDTFDLMLEKGMTYYTDERYVNVIRCEGRVFDAVLEILHAWKYDEDNRLVLKFMYMIKEYIACSGSVDARLNLNGADLSRANLSRANLSLADLSRANLSRADLSGANLILADLSRADLRGADLRGANLSGADLCGADLRGAFLFSADFGGSNLQGVDLSGVYISGANFRAATLDSNNIKTVRKKLPQVVNDVSIYIDALDNKVSYQIYRELSQKGLC